MRKALSFLRQPVFVQLWFLPLWVVLGISKALIFTTSFKWLTPYLGRSEGIHPYIPLVAAARESRARQICRAVHLAARYTPWDSSCFAQAVAARFLLGLYGVPYALYFGLAHDQLVGGMKAHAWVAAGKVSVTGGESFDRFTVVGVFVSPRITHEPNTGTPRA